ncbi:MAG: AI-2E family transporter [Paracoccaceae bacterium]
MPAPTPADGPEKGDGSFGLGRASSTRAGVWVVALVAVIAALDYASAVAIPTVLAALAAIALAPPARRLEAARLPSSLAAGLIVVGVLCATAATLYALAPSAEAWSRRAPEVLRMLEIRAREISGGIERSIGIEPIPAEPPVARRVVGPDVPEEADEGGEDEDDEDDEEDAVDKLVEGGQRLMTDLAISAPTFFGGAIYWAALTYFMLRDRAALSRSVLRLGAGSAARLALGRAMRDVQSNVSRYLLTITVINVGLGACVATAFAVLGVPNAALWGVAAGLLNYMPFVGAAVMTLVTLGVGIVSFEDPVAAFAPVAALVALNTLEAQVVTPLLIGSRMRLSTVGVLVAIAFGAWLWGAAGALIATPVLIVAVAFLTRLAGTTTSRPAGQYEGGHERRRRGRRRSAPARSDDGPQG